MKKVLTDRDRELYILLQMTGHLTFKVRGRELNANGISSMHAAVLDAVCEIGRRATPAEIARHLIREPHTISNLISRMEKQGLVRKVKDLDRKNLVRVELTQKGENAYKEISKGNTIHNLMSDISHAEFQQLTQCLKKIQKKAYEELGRRNFFNKFNSY